MSLFIFSHISIGNIAAADSNFHLVCLHALVPDFQLVPQELSSQLLKATDVYRKKKTKS